MPQTVFITGATGLVGSRLAKSLAADGVRVLALSRKPPAGPAAPRIEWVTGDPAAPGPWLGRLAECDAIVHLAGENVFAKRWTADFMKRLRDSRVDSTAAVAAALAEHPRRADGSAKAFVSASAIGFYGPRGDEELGEDEPPGSDFMAELCAAWERAAEPAKAAGVRVCHPRVGVVLDPAGGALKEIVRPVRLFAGGPIGSGKQWVSWVHHADMTGLLRFALETEPLTGPFNATAPNPARNADLVRGVAKELGRPYWLPAPGFALRVALGKVSDAILNGQRVVPRKATALGYTFRFPELGPALADVLAS